jgi:hypothetical protein
MAYRNSASFGKRQEFIAVAELLRLHFDVYLTLVDDQQIDCVIRQEKEGRLRYLDIQIKARSNECNPNNAGRFAAMEIRNPRKDFYFIFYSEQARTYWVMPSLELIDEANRNKQGVNKGKYSITFCNVSARGVTPRPRFKKYEDAFKLLEWGNEEMPSSSNLSEANTMKGIDMNKNYRKTDSIDTVHTDYQLLPGFEFFNLLKGRRLMTLKDKRIFTLLDIEGNKVFIRVEATGKERKIDIEKEIRPAYEELKKRKRLTRKEIEKNFSPRNPAYVAAILTQFFKVKFSLKPVITLIIE